MALRLEGPGAAVAGQPAGGGAGGQDHPDIQAQAPAASSPRRGSCSWASPWPTWCWWRVAAGFYAWWQGRERQRTVHFETAASGGGGRMIEQFMFFVLALVTLGRRHRRRHGTLGVRERPVAGPVVRGRGRAVHHCYRPAFLARHPGPGLRRRHQRADPLRRDAHAQHDGGAAAVQSPVGPSAWRRPSLVFGGPGGHGLRQPVAGGAGAGAAHGRRRGGGGTGTGHGRQPPARWSGCPTPAWSRRRTARRSPSCPIPIVMLGKSLHVRPAAWPSRSSRVILLVALLGAIIIARD